MYLLSKMLNIDFVCGEALKQNSIVRRCEMLIIQFNIIGMKHTVIPDPHYVKHKDHQ